MSKRIRLSNGMSVLVDDADFDSMSAKGWNACPVKGGKYYYAARSEKNEHGRYGTVMMHRIINQTPMGLVTDHINGDTLDNRRCNLRSVTVAQNRQNSIKRTPGYSKMKGVTWHKRDRRWVARIVCSGKGIHLGYFHSETDAAAAYSAAADRLFGEYNRRV